MATEVNLRPILDRKQWEMCNFGPQASVANSFAVSSGLKDKYQFFAFSAALVYIYDPINDGWMLLPNPVMGGVWGLGSCGARHPQGPRSIATAGTTTTLTTSLSMQRVMKGYTIRIIAGPNAGKEFVIKTNTTGPNSIITIEGTATVAFTNASEFILMTGRMYFLNAGGQSTSSFKYYDLALNSWIAGSFANLPASIGVDGKLVSTPGYSNLDYTTNSVTSATSTVITVTGAGWGVNTWANYQVRITEGTGAGQFRGVISNTATTVTTAAWTVVPDATSKFVIEGNDDYLYFLGNGAVTMYRYSISANTWTVLAPTVARSGAPIGGMSAHWVSGVTDPTWNLPANFLNGQYIYSARGGASLVIDRYNITTNAWENDIVYSPRAETFVAGHSYCYTDDYIYIMQGNLGRMVRYNIPEARMEPSSQLWYTQGAVLQGDRLFDVLYEDGTTKLRYMYYMTASQPTLFRTLLF